MGLPALSVLSKRAIVLGRSGLTKLVKSKAVRTNLVLFASALLLNSLFFFLFPLLHYYQGAYLRDKAGRKKPQVKLALFQVTPREKKVKREKVKKIVQQKQLELKRPDRFKLKLGVAVGTGAAVLADTTKHIIYNRGEVENPPVKLSGRPVRYPAAAEAAGIPGQVELILVISESGKVISVDVVEEKSTRGYGFREAAVNAAWTYRFKPAGIKKIPVKCRISLGINFE